MSKKNNFSKNLVIYTSVIVLILVTIVVMNQKNPEETDNKQRTGEQPSISGQPITGNTASTISIVEFGDYKCPSCKAWGEQVWPQLEQDYILTDTVSFAYINTLFHGAESKLAAQASEVIHMTYPERFWDFHKALYNEQPQADHDSMWVTEAKILEVATATIPELDADKFLQDLSLSSIQQQIGQDQLLVDQFHITQTPTIMVNDIMIKNPFDYEEIRSVIEQELK